MNTCLAPPRGLSHTAAAPLYDRRLVPFPRIRRQLRRRGVSPDRVSSDRGEIYENRIGTALMALYRDTGSARSYEALYAFSRDGVLSWIKSLLARRRSSLDPLELLQDTFINVYRYPRGFRDQHPGSYRVWVRTIAGNIIRRASGRSARFSFQDLPDGLQEPACPAHHPDQQAVQTEENASLKQAWLVFLGHYASAFAKLADRDREALTLVEIDGLAYKDAARILGVGGSNMKMIVFRSRKRLAAHMRDAMVIRTESMN